MFKFLVAIAAMILGTAHASWGSVSDYYANYINLNEVRDEIQESGLQFGGVGARKELRWEVEAKEGHVWNVER